MPLLEAFGPSTELRHALLAEAGQAAGSLIDSEHTVGVRLGIKLVGIADKLFLERLGHIVGQRQGQLLTFYLQPGEACAGVSLADARMAREALAAQQLCAQQTVADIVLGARAENAWGVAPADAYVVEHGGLFQKLPVGTQLRMTAGYRQTTVGDLPTVLQEQQPQVADLGIISI